MIGRSNAGKSSFINGLGGSHKLAQVSSSPGKTRLLNFFDVGSTHRLVDMPGYGFSARSRSEQMSWHTFIEPYLAHRENLAGMLIIMDVRRSWTEDEQMLIDWMRPRGLPAAIVLTKIDKISRSEMLSAMQKLKKASHLDACFATSALKKLGYDELEDYIYKHWIQEPL